MTALNPGGLRLLLACCVSLLPAAAPAAERLEFRKVVPDEEYEAYVKTLNQARLDVAKASADKRPPYATHVIKVEEDSQALRAGLAPGWLMVSYNDEPAWEHTQGMAPGGPDGQTRKSGFLSPSGEAKTFNFKPGKIGFTSENWHHPESFVMQKTPRGPWDRDLLIASEAWPGGRHDIIETALAKARDAGMPDNPISTYYSALLAIDRGADAKARTLWDEAMKDIGGKDISPYYFEGVRTAAWHFRDFSLLRRIVATEAFLPSRIQPAIIDAWAKAPAVTPGPLLPQAKKRADKDVMSTIVTVPDEMWKRWNLVPAEFLQRGWTPMIGIPGKSMAFHFVPTQPVKNVLWEITLAVGNAGPPEVSFPNSFVFALMDRSQTERSPMGIDAKKVISFSVVDQADGQRLIGFGGGLQNGTLYTRRTVPWLSNEEVAVVLETREKQVRPETPALGKTVRLSFVRIGNEAEIFVNGRSWSKMHVPDSVKDLGFFFQVVGTVVVVDKMQLFPLKD